jgi:hypothetical protein
MVNLELLSHLCGGGDSGPNYAKITICRKEAERIIKLSNIIKRNKLYYVVEYDNPPEFYDDEDLKETWKDFYGQGEEGRVDCFNLHVHDKYVNWYGLEHNASEEFSSDDFNIKIFKEYLNILDMNPLDLPLLIGKSEYQCINDLVSKLLKGE